MKDYYLLVGLNSKEVKITKVSQNGSGLVDIYRINEEVPDHSTYSQNYKRKFCKLEKDILQTVFDKVIELLIKYECIDMTAVYIDSTNTKAYANKKKNHKELMKIQAKKYQKELELEIPAFPYSRLGYRKNYFKKYDFIYDEHNDIYICPNEKDLISTGINKDGYIIYKADKNDCKCCPFKDKCTKGLYK